MKYLVQVCMAFGLGLMLVAFSVPQEAQAQGVPECIDTNKAGQSNPQATAAWWGRRSAEEKKYISELPCEERYIPMVCVFLYEPDLRGCTNKGVAEYRADKACTEKGHALLSEAHAACKEDFKKTFSPPFPSAS
ncbi:hypothetical protein [Parvibaculum lavamentivorans]|uniref:hypothetical protein n=1 Tax=Parvibaculum lavamentivorans TaxID=256618 RepID=UPI0002E8B5F7|nr:hypothetical protein [Parvibaculum lavamentivorans]